MTTQTLPGFNVLLEGPSGTGKTHAIGTLVETGLEVFYIAMEPGYESLYGYWRDKGQPVPKNLHVHYLAPAKASFTQMIASANDINTLGLDALSKKIDPNRNTHNQFITLIQALNAFKDENTGEVFEPADTWGTDRCLVIDPMTGINNAAMSLVVGGKPVKSMADWGIAQSQVETLLRMLTDSCRCHFVLTAHIERETDQVLGGSKITVSTLGKALAPKIPAMFSDVILTVREGTNFYWSTANTQADLKTRNLPLSDKIAPDFSAIYKKWKSRQEG